MASHTLHMYTHYQYNRIVLSHSIKCTYTYMTASTDRRHTQRELLATICVCICSILYDPSPIYLQALSDDLYVLMCQGHWLYMNVHIHVLYLDYIPSGDTGMK